VKPRPLFPKKRRPSKGGPAQPVGRREYERLAREAEKARAERHGLYGEALPEEDLEELAEGTLEDALAERRIRLTLAEDAERLRAKRRTPDEETRLLETLRLLANDEEIARLARTRCEFCGADPRSPEYAGVDVLGGRQLSYPGCCLAGQESISDWLEDAPTEDRIRWARALFGPYVEDHGEIANVTGPMGQVERRRRGEWEETDQTADPYQISYELTVSVVRDAESRELVARIVAEHHAHMAWEAGTAWKFGITVHNGPDLVGVAWIQNPGSRMFPQDGTWLDVARVAIRRDLPPFLRGNAASLIYSTAWQVARDGSWVAAIPLDPGNPGGLTVLERQQQIDVIRRGPLDDHQRAALKVEFGALTERANEEWGRIRSQSDQKRERAEAAAAGALEHKGTPSPALVAAWGAALALIKPVTWEKVRNAAQFTADHPWRVQRNAIRMITYTLEGEEVGTTLKSSGWEPAAWSAPHKTASGARKGRDLRASAAAKIRWQVGIPEHARPIVLLERQLAHEDRVAVGLSRGGLRPAGSGASTLALRVYGILTGPRGEVPPHQNAVTWQETATEEAGRPKGARRLMNPLRRVHRNMDAGRRAHEREALRDGADRSKTLVDRLRAGLVTPEHLSVAGYLGDAAAAQVVPAWVAPESASHLARQALRYGPISVLTAVRIGADLASRALPAFEVVRPQDGRPHAAIAATHAWVACPCDSHRQAVESAAQDLDACGRTVTDTSPAGYAVTAVGYASDAVEPAATGDAEGAVGPATGSAASYAFTAVRRQGIESGRDLAEFKAVLWGEREWQRLHMIAVLTGDLPLAPPAATNPLRHRKPDRLDPNTPEEREPDYLRGAISPCGSKPKAIDYHVVEGRGGGATLILDVGNVRHYGPELFYEDRCPLLAGFREGRSVVTRPGVAFGGAPVYSKSFDLENLAHRVGLPLARVEHMLVLEGRAWARARGRAK